MSFFETYAGAAQSESARSGIPASIILAQAALESGWGKSSLVDKALNFFGIKAGKSWEGGTYYATTTEYENGQYVNTVAGFRSYDTAADSFADHSDFLMNNPRYAGVFKTNDPKQVAKELQAAGYATDPNYADKLISLIDQYGLTSYDTGEAPKGAGIVTASAKPGNWASDIYNKVWGEGGWLDWAVPDIWSNSISDGLNGKIHTPGIDDIPGVDGIDDLKTIGHNAVVTVVVILLLVGVFFLLYKMIGGVSA